MQILSLLPPLSYPSESLSPLPHLIFVSIILQDKNKLTNKQKQQLFQMTSLLPNQQLLSHLISSQHFPVEASFSGCCGNDPQQLLSFLCFSLLPFFFLFPYPKYSWAPELGPQASFFPRQSTWFPRQSDPNLSLSSYIYHSQILIPGSPLSCESIYPKDISTGLSQQAK